MKTLTNRLTDEQRAELQKRWSERHPAEKESAIVRRLPSAVSPTPQRTYNPVGANTGLATQYKICGTCGGSLSGQ